METMTNKIETAAKPELERETCTRCGGSGHYSRCEMYGTTCFRCKGRKITLTARGAAAAAYLTALRSKPASAVVVGDAIMDDNTGKFYAVVSVGPWAGKSYATVNGVQVEHQMIDIVTTRGGRVCGAATPVRIMQTAEQSASTFADAMAYQATLTKHGKPRK